ncbi:MAG: YceI family protein, partial [Betaproteobacteria bacterium]
MNSARGRRRTLAFVALIWPAMLLQTASAAPYTIDPRDTSANFDVRFLGLFPLHGRFLRTSGMLFYDRETRQGSIDVVIDTTTLVSNNAKAQSLARGPEFFDVEKYPSIAFKSSRFVFDERHLRFIEGSLTLVGHTRPVVLTVTNSRCDAATEHELASCHATAELVVKRSAFGMKAWSRTVSEEVVIRITIAARQATERAPHPVLPGAEPPGSPE